MFVHALAKGEITWYVIKKKDTALFWREADTYEASCGSDQNLKTAKRRFWLQKKEDKKTKSEEKGVWN